MIATFVSTETFEDNVLMFDDLSRSGQPENQALKIVQLYKKNPSDKKVKVMFFFIVK